jgi:putative ABC transport system substrate-binding protein
MWLVTTVVTLVVCGAWAEAQQQAKIPMIGWLGERGSGSGRESFRRQFHELGYVESKNIAFEYRYAENKLDRLPALADELVPLKVDALVTPSAWACGPRDILFKIVQY